MGYQQQTPRQKSTARTFPPIGIRGFVHPRLPFIKTFHYRSPPACPLLVTSAPRHGHTVTWFTPSWAELALSRGTAATEGATDVRGTVGARGHQDLGAGRGGGWRHAAVILVLALAYSAGCSCSSLEAVVPSTGAAARPRHAPIVFVRSCGRTCATTPCPLRPSPLLPCPSPLHGAAAWWVILVIAVTVLLRGDLGSLRGCFFDSILLVLQVWRHYGIR